MKLFTACIAATALFAAPAFAHEEETAATRGAPVKAENRTVEAEKADEALKHSGGTDSRGCHTNHKTGEYHCHTPK